MNKTDLRRVIRAGGMNECWVKLADGREFFARKVVVTDLGAAQDATFYTADGPLTASIVDIVSAVH